MTLQPHQEEVAATGEDDAARVLLYHSLGSGKTLSSIAAAERAGDPYTAVVPASLRPNFKGERAKFTDEAVPAAVASYNAVARGTVPPADTLVLDEAHRLRNPDALTTRNATALADRARHVYLLSGSPIVNHPHDLAPLIRILTGKAYSPEEFDARFLDERKISPGFLGWLQGVKPVTVPVMANQDEFAELLRGHVHYHAPERPEVEEREERYEVEMGPEQTRLYRGFWDQLPWLTRWKLQNDFPLSRKELVKLSAFLSGPRQVGLSTYPFMKGKADALKAFRQSPKLQLAAEKLREALADPAQKAMVYSNFVDAGLTPYAAALAEAKVPFGIFHGGLNDAARKRAVADYNAGRTRVLLVGPAGSEGISLKGTRLLQVLDPHWNSARSDQAVGRGVRFDSHAHLPREDRNVRVQHFGARLPRTLWQRLWRATVGHGEKEDPRRDSPGVDFYLENMARRKDELNGQFLEALRRVGSAPLREPPGLLARLFGAGKAAEDGTPGRGGLPPGLNTNIGPAPLLVLVRRTTIAVLPAGPEGPDEPDEPDRDEPPFTVAVDLDGTLAAQEEPFDPGSIGPPRPRAQYWLRRLRDAGARIIVFTVRGDRDLVADWLREHEMPFDHINENPDQPPDSSGKVLADVYWDDRAVPAGDLDATGPEILERLAEKTGSAAWLVPADVLVTHLEEGLSCS